MMIFYGMIFKFKCVIFVTVLHDHIYSIGIQGAFLFISVDLDRVSTSFTFLTNRFYLMLILGK